MMNFADIKYLGTQTFKEWGDDKASRLAAALAYYTVFSIPPLLILFLVIAGQVYDETAVRSQLLTQISGLVGETGAEAIAAILENASRPGGTIIATVVSFVTLIFGASGVFGQLHDAFNVIWDVEQKETGGMLDTIKDRFFSFTMVLGVGFLLLVSLVISSVLAGLNELINSSMPTLIFLAQMINFFVSFGIISLLFALIFKIVPDIEIEWRDVWIGAIVTAFLFTVGKWGIGLYLGNSAPSSTYGAAGSLIVILLWVYYSTQILFLGAEFTQVYATKFGSGVRAEEGAVIVSDLLNEEPSVPQIVNPALLRETAVSTPPAPVPKPLRPLEQPINRLQSGVVTVFGTALGVWGVVKQIFTGRRRNRRASYW